MEASERHTPFYCGSQRADWKHYNCDSCRKAYDEAAMKWRCDLERKIDEAYMGDGTFDAETAKRMGTPVDCRVYNWRCPEFDPAPPKPPAPTLSAVNAPADWISAWADKRGITLKR